MIGQVADLARATALAKVSPHLCRTNDGLGLEDERRGKDARESTKCLGNSVHFILVLAVCS